jgi:short subunit dehydrogenase-like uncharacterized protein
MQEQKDSNGHPPHDNPADDVGEAQHTIGQAGQRGAESSDGPVQEDDGTRGRDGSVGPAAEPTAGNTNVPDARRNLYPRQIARQPISYRAASDFEARARALASGLQNGTTAGGSAELATKRLETAVVLAGNDILRWLYFVEYEQDPGPLLPALRARLEERYATKYWDKKKLSFLLEGLSKEERAKTTENINRIIDAAKPFLHYQTFKPKL